MEKIKEILEDSMIRDIEERIIAATYDDLTGMNCPPPNWNEGLDQELTKDLHLNMAFHGLFDNSLFALTDFIFCRDFYAEFNIELQEDL